MNTTAQLAGIIHGVLTQPTGGIIGLVDDLLVVCVEHGLQLEWQADRCRFRLVGGDWEELTDVPLPKAVFRAILARMAALCNEHAGNTVSPYGGQGEFSVKEDAAAVVRVAFSNTPTAQKLELTASARPSAEFNGREQAAQDCK